MKKIVIYAMGIAFSLGLISCREIKGTLAINEEMTVKTKKQDPWCNPENIWEDCEEEKTLVLTPGEYAATLEPKSNDQAMFKVKIGNKEESLEINIPKGKKIPDWSGTFSFTSAELGQTWDVNGIVDTIQTRSELYKETERCEYELSRQVCGPSGPNNEHRCWIEVVKYPGRRYVEFYINYYDKSVLMNFLKPAASTVVAHWNGRSQTSERYYTYTGICR